MDILIDGFELRELASKNVILGKNGCGKSYLMKRVEERIRNNREYGLVRYISPERGGTLIYEPSIDQAISQNLSWINDTRRQNQSANFRQQSATLFRRLELLVLREIEAEHTKEGYVPQRFEDTIDRLNVLLERVRLERESARPFRIVDRETGEEADPSAISSGESELISLGIEILTFVKESDPSRQNILLIDEPDVHLHPDLQDRLARFMIDALEGKAVTLILATHSTALLAGLAESPDTRVAFKRRQVPKLTFKAVSDIDRAILPIFGAHPLSNVFNQAPILLVEGEDDERIWQQAVRSAGGAIRVFPCVTDSVDRLSQFETEVNNVIETVYDDAKAYSLRDRDVGPEAIDDVGHVIRMRLSCRAAENLMLSDEALAAAGTNWTELQEGIRCWVQSNTGHRFHADMRAFVDSGFDRKGHDLKTIRNILIGLMSTKPWEVLVGQTIAALSRSGGPNTEGSLRDYLGAKVCENLLGISEPVTPVPA
jgi:energy-coupling factor transporter ATP-binding protein EcfA2